MALLAGATRKAHLERAGELLRVAPPAAPDARAEPDDIRPPLPCCGGRMVVIETLPSPAPGPGSTGSCAVIPDTGVVTRHRQGAIYLAVPMLAEAMAPAPIAIRGATTSSNAALSALANPSCPPESGQSAPWLAPTSAMARATETGRKTKTP